MNESRILTVIVSLVVMVVFQMITSFQSRADSLDNYEMEYPVESTIIVSGDNSLRNEAENAGYRVTTSVQQALDISDAGNTIFICKGQYQSFHILEKVQLNIIGNDETYIVAENVDDDIVQIVSSRNIKIKWLTTYHNEGGVNSVCYGFCFFICQSDEIEISNCQILGCGSVGVTVCGSQDVFIHDNCIHDCSYCGVQIHAWDTCGDWETSDQIEILDNYFYNNVNFTNDTECNLIVGQNEAYDDEEFYNNNYFFNPYVEHIDDRRF